MLYICLEWINIHSIEILVLSLGGQFNTDTVLVNGTRWQKLYIVIKVFSSTQPRRKIVKSVLAVKMPIYAAASDCNATVTCINLMILQR